METKSSVTPKDFFLWLGAVVALYGSIIAFFTLVFEYINRAYPDALAGYADPYAGAVRFGMAALIVLVPVMLGLFMLIRKSIEKEPGKAQIWVRRWALVLTLFIAGVTIAIDLITLITTFLGGEITIRFVLKTLVVLLVAAAVFLHYLADLRGYWLVNQTKAKMVGAGVLLVMVLTVLAGFFVVGTPQDMRMERFDAQKVSDLQTIQWQLVNYYQQKQTLPESLAVFNDPISSFAVPKDPQTGGDYRYEVTGNNAFVLCATFNRPSRDTEGQGGYMMGRDVAMPSMGGMSESWTHGVGETCFDRSIDPALYPPFPKPL